ncbi:MAG: thiamine pyrophosphate-binding protein [Bacteroidota bacterium]|nr:thiamine pyrophosphate-binding protein [Bacteroidota bacterium]
MKVSDFIAFFLEKKGISHIFELSGGMITHILDSLNQNTGIGIISMHHEQAAAFAADAYGRITGLPGIALATSGPGATNLLTGIASCYFDSSPAIFITGQVNRHEQKGNRPIRQLGFQETDIVSMALPVTKASFLVNEPSDIPKIFNEAFYIATEGRPGPVLIDIPMDVQRAQINVPAEQMEIFIENREVDAGLLLRMVADIRQAKRPVILAGRGVRSSFSTELLLDLSQKLHVPVITTLLALDVIPAHHPLRVGFIGSYGNRWANTAFGESDFILVLGSRLDIRQTGADTAFFENRKIYHVDCNAGEINSRIKGCVPIVQDVKLFIKNFLCATKDEIFHPRHEWINYIENLKSKWPDINELTVVANTINPNVFMHHLSDTSASAKVVLADVGAHQMWAAQSLEIKSNQLFITSGGMGSMGFALPASIGASLAFNRQAVLVLIGDGCMQLNIQELQTIVRNKLPIKIVVMNNENLGMIRQFQDSYFESRYQSTYWGYTAPNFEKIAIAYGISGKTISRPEEVRDAVNWLWNDENFKEPVLLQVMIDPHTNTYPKIAFGKPITEMEPFAKPIEMEGT